MLWVIRGTDEHTQQDLSVVVEAKTRAEAECFALKRGLPVVFIGPASDIDVETAKEAKLLWAYTPKSRYSCFGQVVSHGQLACLMLCGLATIALHLRSAV